ncbi:hypothetical protein DFH28DRAFT_1122824 [Melampsora americana]|nr:hypothetical protein DFH28DRAFT_1122824 [Melampsora americana]
MTNMELYLGWNMSDALKLTLRLCRVRSGGKQNILRMPDAEKVTWKKSILAAGKAIGIDAIRYKNRSDSRRMPQYKNIDYTAVKPIPLEVGEGWIGKLVGRLIKINEGKPRPVLEEGTIWSSNPNRRYTYTIRLCEDDKPEVLVEQV